MNLRSPLTECEVDDAAARIALGLPLQLHASPEDIARVRELLALWRRAMGCARARGDRRLELRSRAPEGGP